MRSGRVTATVVSPATVAWALPPVTQREECAARTSYVPCGRVTSKRPCASAVAVTGVSVTVTVAPAAGPAAEVTVPVSLPEGAWVRVKSPVAVAFSVTVAAVSYTHL